MHLMSGFAWKFFSNSFVQIQGKLLKYWLKLVFFLFGYNFFSYKKDDLKVFSAF